MFEYLHALCDFLCAFIVFSIANRMENTMNAQGKENGAYHVSDCRTTYDNRWNDGSEWNFIKKLNSECEFDCLRGYSEDV